MKNIKLKRDEVIKKIENKETFILALTATWCPPCNILKYGTEKISSGRGLMYDNLIYKMYMFEEDFDGRYYDELKKGERNSQLHPLIKKIEESSGINHRDMTFVFNDDLSVRLEPNMDSYRPPVPALMVVKKGVPTGFYVYPNTQEKMDIVIKGLE